MEGECTRIEVGTNDVSLPFLLTFFEALLDNTEPLGQRRKTQLEYPGAMSWMRRVVAGARNLPRRVNTP